MFSKLKKRKDSRMLFDKKRRKSHQKVLGNINEDWDADAKNGVLSH
jgi:hypothetical protein